MLKLYSSKFKRFFILTFAISSMLVSCSVSTILKIDAPTSNCATSGQDFCNSKTVTASIWRGRAGKKDLRSLCENGISRVKVTTKPADVFVGFITLGFVVKQRIQWECSQRTGSSDIP